MVVYSDELCHWAKGSTTKDHKYIKREWKNGRWRYYYSKAKKTIDDKIGFTARKNLINYGTFEDGVNYGLKEYIAKNNIDATRKEMSDARNSLSGIKGLKDSPYKKSLMDSAYDRLITAEKRNMSAQGAHAEASAWYSRYVDLQEKYDATFLGKAEKKIKSARNWLANR